MRFELKEQEAYLVFRMLNLTSTMKLFVSESDKPLFLSLYQKIHDYGPELMKDLAEEHLLSLAKKWGIKRIPGD